MQETTKKELFSVEQLDSIISAAKAAPDSVNKQRYNLQKSVIYLYPALCEMRDKKGYSYAELVDFLKRFEIEISEATLKSYLKKHQKMLADEAKEKQQKKARRVSNKKLEIPATEAITSTKSSG